jgi:L-rhamnose mutarotase
MGRLCLALDLVDNPSLIARYLDWHRVGGVPREVIDSMKKVDITDMEIWQVADRLFMIMETGPNFSAEAKADDDANSTVVQAWEALMSTFQKPLPTAPTGVKWLPMSRIFNLDDHKNISD